MLTPADVVSTATTPEPVRRDDHVGDIGVRDEVGDTARPQGPVAMRLTRESKQRVRVPQRRAPASAESRAASPIPTPSQSMASAAYIVL